MWIPQAYGREGYDVAQICLNGHTANSSTLESPEFNKDYCDKCGEKTVTFCLHCKTPIRGHYHIPGWIGVISYHPPSYCYACGKPFPWIEKKIQAAIELSKEDGLSEEEAKQFEDSVKDIISDTPRTPLAASRFMKLMGKVGTGTASAIRDIFVDIASETAKKMIWPNG
ncbi:MAG: hypothetical protein QG610_429 [Euryarchaeota archaeon]|nr:hypothetical protein [Euryarchaeota archaeon]